VTPASTVAQRRRRLIGHGIDSGRCTGWYRSGRVLLLEISSRGRYMPSFVWGVPGPETRPTSWRMTSTGIIADAASRVFHAELSRGPRLDRSKVRARPGDQRSLPGPEMGHLPLRQRLRVGAEQQHLRAGDGRGRGGTGLRPPGWLPAFNDAPPLAGTANPALDARFQVLGRAAKIDCDDNSCHEYGF
jgi:hypothetical protein